MYLGFVMSVHVHVLTKFRRASGITSTRGGKTCKAPSPPLNTTWQNRKRDNESLNNQTHLTSKIIIIYWSIMHMTCSCLVFLYPPLTQWDRSKLKAITCSWPLHRPQSELITLFSANGNLWIKVTLERSWCPLIILCLCSVHHDLKY